VAGLRVKAGLRESNHEQHFVTSDRVDRRRRAASVDESEAAGNLWRNHQPLRGDDHPDGRQPGFDARLVRDATWTFDRVGPDGDAHTAEDIHAMTLANLNGEFARIVSASEAISGLKGG
jgi:hypothetical protein